MTDNQQQAESGTERLLRIGTLTLTVLGPVLNTLAARLADRLERGGKRTKVLEKLDVEDIQKQPNGKHPLGHALQERGEILIQELEELVERGTKLSQSLVAHGSDVTHELAERGNTASQNLLRHSEEVRGELRSRGKQLNKRSQKVVKELNKRSQKVAKELSRRSEKVTKELSKRSRQTTRQISERNGTFWVISGFVVGLAAAGATAYLLIKQRVRQQQQLEAEPSFLLQQNGYLNTRSSAQGKNATYTTPNPVIQQEVPSSLTEEAAVAVAEQENKMPVAQSAPSNAVFIGVVGTQRYYPISTPLDQLAMPEARKNAVIYFTTEEEAQKQGYSSGL
jgi:hypothetical protein